MPLSVLVASLALTLGADPSPPSVAHKVPLPRSSIAAVLAHQGELGLSAAQVRQLEERDEALQKQIAELGQGVGATPSRGEAGSRRKEGRPGSSPDSAPPPLSPAASARPEGVPGGGGHRPGGMGGRRVGGRGAPAAQDPAVRAAALQSRIDDADTAAWLAAESLLPEAQREKARDIAEKYRETLADQRESERAGASATHAPEKSR